jgi:predicted transcriptional regulator
MTDNVDDKLNQVLDINTDMKKDLKKVPTVRTDLSKESLETDYRYARENLYDLVERGQDALDGILDLSKEMENPRAYEVAGQILKTTSEIAEKLLDLQVKMKNINKEEIAKEGDTHNHLYVGSTSDLQKYLKKNKHGQSEE